MNIVTPKECSIKLDGALITAILEFAKNKLLVAYGINLLVIKNWFKVMKIDEPNQISNEKYWLATMPGFDEETFPFCISHGSPSFNLINVKKFSNEVLIHAPERHYYG